MSTTPEILVVDDEPALRLLLQEFFKRDFRVVPLKDGTETLQWLIKNELPTLAIIDLMMPGLSGLELIKTIRAKREWDELSIVVLSAKESSIDRVNALNAGADDFVVKPFNPEELRARINSVLRRARH
ncbi:MAG: response regulator transcription factor [Cyclobacteriaceae bacterium]|nr:response regulator transcription factor [Cyclobacteriaceae bacterium]